MASSLARAILVTLLIGPLSGLCGGATTAAQTIDCAAVGTRAVASPDPTAVATPAPATAVAFPAEGGELTVFAAASLTDAFNRVGADIEAANPAVRVTFNFAGSQTLATQITQGAPADVFASANAAQMQVVVDAGLIAGGPVTFARNRLAVVVPADNPAGIAAPVDLAKPDLRLVLASADVPVGRYSRQSLCAMGASSYGADFVAAVGDNVVSEEEDARAVLTKVQLGEADAGIVYVSDVTADVAGDVRLIEIPDAVNVLASYPIAPVADGNETLATAFIAYVLSPRGQATLAEFGFVPVHAR